MKDQQQKIDATKLSSQQRPEPKTIDDKTEKIRKEAGEKILAMKSTVAAAYCKDDDSIATIEDELESIAGNQQTINHAHDL